MLAARPSAAETAVTMVFPEIGYDLDDAARLLDEAIDELAPIDEPDLYLARGILRFRTLFAAAPSGRPSTTERGASWEEIESDFRFAAAKGEPSGHYYQGFVALERDVDPAAAAAHFRAAWLGGMRSDEILENLTWAFFGARDYAGVRDLLTPVVAEQGSAARFHALAAAHLGLNDLDNAILWGERALVAGEYLETRMILGVAYYERQDLDAARAHFERALDGEPNRRGALMGLLTILVELDQRDDAALVVEKLRESFPEDAGVQELLRDLLLDEQVR